MAGAAVTWGAAGAAARDSTRAHAAARASERSAGRLAKAYLRCAWPQQHRASGQVLHNQADSGDPRHSNASAAHPPGGVPPPRPKGRERPGPDGRCLRTPVSPHNRRMSVGHLPASVDVAQLEAEIATLRDERQRAECMASIQRDAVQLALDLLVTTPTCAASSACSSSGWSTTPAAHACGGVWLLDETTSTCDLWMANIGGETLTAESAGVVVARHCRARAWRGIWSHSADCRTGVVRVSAATTRGCPNRCARSIAPRASEPLLVAPLTLAPKTLGWVALTSTEERPVRGQWRRRAARRDRAAGDARALLQPRRRSEPARGETAGGARGAQPHRARHSRHAGAGLRRDPDAAAGGPARGVRAAGGGDEDSRDRRRPRPHAPGRGAPIGRGAASAVERARRRRLPRCSAWSISRSAPTTCRSIWSSTSCRRSTPASNARSSASRRRR